MSGVGGGTVPHYDPREGNKSMFNNPKLSDIHFLIGGKKIYGHKMVLSMASPVFESMFYGELEEQLREIKIEGLSLVGFENALRLGVLLKRETNSTKNHMHMILAYA